MNRTQACDIIANRIKKISPDLEIEYFPSVRDMSSVPLYAYINPFYRQLSTKWKNGNELMTEYESAVHITGSNAYLEAQKLMALPYVEPEDTEEDRNMAIYGTKSVLIESSTRDYKITETYAIILNIVVSSINIPSTDNPITSGGTKYVQQ